MLHLNNFTSKNLSNAIKNMLKDLAMQILSIIYISEK